ncbi:hypothetical protein GUJ93_ZPchr0006g46407 [Zizania palustris]|uniref:Uncharacterized protein n=1 Tax=Zizania palustris TaxID=103762 RepID=A0A8J5SSR4_ZIZPA|nr:hypothetical protein GUJ93_ZPchr0006g46407 [Zizania palustris]
MGHLHLLAKNGPNVSRAIAIRKGVWSNLQPPVIVANAELCKEVDIKKFKYIRNRSTLPPNVSTLHQDSLFLTRTSEQYLGFVLCLMPPPLTDSDEVADAPADQISVVMVGLSKEENFTWFAVSFQLSNADGMH